MLASFRIHLVISLATLSSYNFAEARVGITLRVGAPFSSRGFGGIDIHHAASVGFHAYGKFPKTFIVDDMKDICCAKNFSAVWDRQGELLAVAIEDTFCMAEIERQQELALAATTMWMMNHENKSRGFINDMGDFQRYEDNLEQEDYYGAFPGAMGRYLPDNVKIDIAEKYEGCVGQFTAYLSRIKSKRLKRLGEVSWHPVSCFFGIVCSASKDLENYQSCPHTDMGDHGIATILTLTRKTKFEECGTALASQGPRKLSIIDSESDRKYLQQWNSRQQDNLGYLNGTGNSCAKIIAVVRNKFNLAAAYLSNRLHAAYIPDDSLLACNPVHGRLTMNLFWRVVKFPL